MPESQTDTRSNSGTRLSRGPDVDQFTVQPVTRHEAFSDNDIVP